MTHVQYRRSNTYQPQGHADRRQVGRQRLRPAHFTVENPAKRTPIADVPRAARPTSMPRSRPRTRPSQSWKKVVPRERGKLLLKIAEAIEARSRGAGPHHRARDRQRAAHPGARRGQHDGRHLPLLRRARLRAEGRDHAARRARAVLHPARADRRRRRHHPVERAGDAGRAQDRARARAPATRWC